VGIFFSYTPSLRKIYFDILSLAYCILSVVKVFHGELGRLSLEVGECDLRHGRLDETQNRRS
jgi:hypothetical protein